MKTKKGILGWWYDTAKKPITESKTDRTDFFSKVDNTLIQIDSNNYGLCKGKNIEVIFLNSRRWKHKMELYFRYGECIKIVGF